MQRKIENGGHVKEKKHVKIFVRVDNDRAL